MTLPEWRVEEFARLPSTQDAVKQRLGTDHDADGLVIRAAEQRSGVGQRGRVWMSALGGSYQSLALKDKWNGALKTPCLTLLVALCIAEELRASGAKATVKWPNDVYLGEGKLAGVLTEYTREHLVVGVGVNVNNPVPDGASALYGWKLEFVNGLVLDCVGKAVAELLGAHADRHVADGSAGLGEGLPSGLREGLRAVLGAGERTEPENTGGRSDDPVTPANVASLRSLSRRFSELDHLRGRTVSVSTKGSTLTGQATGVDSNGSLLIKVSGASKVSEGHAGDHAEAQTVVSVASGTVISWL